MINERIDSLIAESMKSKDPKRTSVLRAIKDTFLVEQKSGSGKEWSESTELILLKRMIKQRLDSYEQYKAAGRNDLADIENNEVTILKRFVPGEATEEDLNIALYDICKEKEWGGELEWNGKTAMCPNIPKKCMGEAIKLVKDRLANVDGKVLADKVKRYIDNSTMYLIKD